MAVLSRGTRARLAPSSTTSPVWPGVPGDQVLGGPGRSPDLGGPGGALHRAPHRPNDQGKVHGAGCRQQQAIAAQQAYRLTVQARVARSPLGISLRFLINAGGSRITTSNCSPSAFSAARLQKHRLHQSPPALERHSARRCAPLAPAPRRMHPRRALLMHRWPPPERPSHPRS